MPPIIERALFIVAPQDSGKSTQLRSMFLDRRFGTYGKIPPSSGQRKLVDTYYISNERRLYLRLTSPHENWETPRDFLNKAKEKMSEGRWCFAGPLQPDAFRKMPDVVKTVGLFIKAFRPQRVRVIFLSPNHHEKEVSSYIPGRDLVKELHKLNDVEVLCADARQRNTNGLIYADFFDFT